MSLKKPSAINDEITNSWRGRFDCVELVKALETYKIHFRMFPSSLPCVSAVTNCPAVPHTMTAEAISWRTRYPSDTSVFPLERFYSDKEREAYIKVASRNALAQEDINEAWTGGRQGQSRANAHIMGQARPREK